MGTRFNDCDLSGADFSALNLSGAILTGVDLSEANLRDVNLEEAELQNVIFKGADLQDSHLAGALLAGASFEDAHLEGADFSEASLQGANLAQIEANGADFSNADLRDAILKHADLSESVLNGCDMRGITLDEANLKNTDLAGVNLSGANLNHLDLRSADLSQANLVEADLTYADFSNGEYRDLNLQGADLTGANLSGATFFESIFSDATLSGADLMDADVRENDFSNANLAGATLSGTRLAGANLSEAHCGGLDLHTTSLFDTDMAGINLEGANLSGRDLSGINFGRANLVDTNFQSADLSGADLSQADLRGTNFRYGNLGGADLSGQDITKVELAGAYLQGSNFSSADLSEMYLHGVNLEQADLSGAKLTNVVLQSADLEDADLSDAVLNGADLRLVNFRGASFQGVSLEGTLLTYSDFYGATGLTDEALDVAVGLVNGTYFQPRQEIIDALSGVCRGTGAPEAASYQGVLGLQPAVLLSESGESHEWSENIPSDWEPTGIRFAQLVACVQPQQSYVISSTPYCLGTSYCSDPTYLQRHSYRVTVEIRRAREGTLVTSQTFYGGSPRAAKNTESWSTVNSGLWGSKVTFSSIEGWLKGYIAPRSYTCEDELGCVDVVPGAPIEVGAIFALSDIYGYLGEDALRGMEIAAEDIGEVLGHPIKITPLDSACSAEVGEALAERLATNQWLIGAVGTTCGAPTYEAASVLSDEGMVLISPSVSTAWLTNPEYLQEGFLRVIPNDLEQAELVAEFAFRELGARRMATIHQGLNYGEDLQAKACEVFTSLGGECVIQREYEEGATDLQELANAVVSASPDVIFIPVLRDVGVEIVKQARGIDALNEVNLIGTDTLFSDYILDATGGASEGLYFSGLMIGSDYYTPSYEQFLEKYSEKYGSDPQGLFHAYGYDALLLLARTIEKTAVKDPDGMLHIPRQALRDALFSTRYLQGLTGNLNCTTEGDCGGANAIRILQVVDSDPSTYLPGADEASNPKVVYP
jgi:branched-chain amino acid transport system substrate-binding protein